MTTCDGCHQIKTWRVQKQGEVGKVGREGKELGAAQLKFLLLLQRLSLGRYPHVPLLVPLVLSQSSGFCPVSLHILCCVTSSRGEDKAPAPPQAARNPQRGTWTCWRSAKSPCYSEPSLTRSPAVGAVPAHSFKLMVPAQDPRTVGFLRGNFTWKVMNPQAMQRSKQTKRLEHLVWLTLEVSGRQWKQEGGSQTLSSSL